MIAPRYDILNYFTESVKVSSLLLINSYLSIRKSHSLGNISFYMRPRFDVLRIGTDVDFDSESS